MATNELQAREIIKKLVKTEGFTNLPASSRNKLIQRVMQKEYNIVPNTEKLLSGATKSLSLNPISNQNLRNSAILGTHALNTMSAGGSQQIGKAANLIGNIIGDKLELPTSPEAEYFNLFDVNPTTDPGNGIGGFINMIRHPINYQENVAEGLGNVLGFSGGGIPGAAFKNIEKNVAGLATKKFGPGVASFIARTLGRMGGGAAAGALAPVEGDLSSKEGVQRELKGRGINSLIGTVLGPLIGGIGELPGAIKKFSGIKQEQTKLSLNRDLTVQALDELGQEKYSPKIEKSNRRIAQIKQEQASQNPLSGKTPKYEEPKIDPKELDDLLTGSGAEVDAKISTLESTASAKFGEGLQNVKHTPTRGQLGSLYERVLEQIDPQGTLRELSGTPANKVNKLYKDLLPLDKEGNLLKNPSEVMTPESTQGIHRKTMSSFSDINPSEKNVRIKYSRAAHELLDVASPELVKLKAEYAPKFKTVDLARQNLKPVSIKAIATGRAGQIRSVSAEEAAKGIKSSSVDNAKALFEKHQRAISDAQAKHAKEVADFESKSQVSEKGYAIRKLTGDKQITALEKHKTNLKANHESEMRDLQNAFKEEAERLSLDQQELYRILVSSVSGAAMLGMPSVRRVFKEKF